jgi:hypothetical protein
MVGEIDPPATVRAMDIVGDTAKLERTTSAPLYYVIISYFRYFWRIELI